jgi:Protein of unknown function (DUF3040)
MSLTARERQALNAIARRVRAEDPVLARRLSTFGGRLVSVGGRAAAAPRRKLVPIVLVVVLMIVGVLLLPQGTAHGWPAPGPAAPAPHSLR